jgi:hypothetical protein
MHKQGTVERHGSIDARDVNRSGLLSLPAGEYRLSGDLRWPWIRLIRTTPTGTEIIWRDGHAEHVSLAWVRCGAIGVRSRFERPRCCRRFCKLYDLGGTHACRKCGRLWYGCQRRSANGRRCLRVQRLRLKLGGGASLKSLGAFPPRPRSMWRRNYERHRDRDVWLGRRLNRFQWRESWFRKSARDDRWSFCLTAGTLCPANQEKP